MITAVDWTVIALYLATMIGIGFAVTRGIRRFKDYFLASGALTTPLLVCTLVSTYYELDVTFATSEQGFHRGVVAWFWWSRPYYLAILIAAFFLSRRLKEFDFLTLPDLLEHRYGTGARVTGAIACFIYSLPITALMGMLALFEVLGVPRVTGLAVGVGVCLVYTAAGGLWADAVTDTVQFALMAISMAFVVPAAVALAGGFDGLRASLPGEFLLSTGGVSPWLILAWSLAALTIFVEPAFYQRILAARDAAQVRRALVIGIFLWAAYDWAATLVGMSARAAVENGVLPAATDGSHALLAIALQTLPIGMKGLFLAGVLAAAMSSIDSYSLLASGNLVYDILRPLSRREWSEATLVRWTRIGIAIILVPSIAIALYFERISDAWFFMASVLTSVVFVPAVGGLLFRPPRLAGLASSVAGLAALLVFYAAIHAWGTPFAEEETWIWRGGGIEIWREYAVLFALPVSAAAFGFGWLYEGRRHA